MLIPLISIPYISRVLDPAGVGKVGFIDSFTYYFIAIAEFGIVVYGTREVARLRDDREALRQLVAELLVLHLVTSACAILLYSVAIFIIWERLQDTRLLLFSFSFLLVNSFACEWYFLGTERFKYITIRSLITRMLGLASIFFLIKLPADYYLYYGIMVVAACCNGVWNTVSLFRELPLQFKGLNWKRHIRLTLVTYAISLLYSVTIMLDNVLVGLASTAAAVAFYSFAAKIIRVAAVLLSDSLLVFFPKIVHLIKEKKTEEMQLVLLRNVQFIIFFSVPLCAGLFLLSDELVNVYLGKSFFPVAENIRIIALLPFVKLLSLFIARQVLVANNKEKLSMFSLAVGSCTMLVLMPAFSFYFSSKGACIAITATEIVILSMNWYYASKLNPILKIFDFKGFLHAIVAALIFVPVTALLRSNTGGGVNFLLLAALSCCVVYFFVQTYVLRNVFARYIHSLVINYLAGRLKLK